MLLMRRLYLRHYMRQRVRRITQLKRRLRLCQLTVGILLMRRLDLRHYMRHDRRITQLIRRLRLCQLTVDMFFMRRLHLRHYMRQRRRRITQRKRRQLHKIHIQVSIRCRIIIQLHQWHPEESLIRDLMDIRRVQK